MADAQIDTDGGFDPQDTAEVFDETHLDDDGDGDILLGEMDVFDATRPHDERQNRPVPEEDFSEEDEPSALEIEANSLLAASPVPDSDEIELVYTGLMRNQRGAQGSAAHWEAKRLSDEDVGALGYKDTNEETP
ncbi:MULTISPECIES: hypothetical protein [unclassified Brevundimonas]|uniref:hypothetical protein n=1 Tax=unclassified Brevundimonas TaxID=2622653 RepID=UPI0025BBFD91|nr:MULTISPECIES: hypothetical protein [unclassified Brevundimonas]